MENNHNPVYRKDILKCAKEYRRTGLCSALDFACSHLSTTPDYNRFQLNNIYEIFPLFTRENALKFNADEKSVYWWDPGVWDTGREQFLDWLIEQYKDDNEDISYLL